ncbi:MAG: hypothetical protein ACR650_09775 [Methylocystis sp.]
MTPHASLESLIEQAAENGWDFFDGPGGRGAQTRAAMSAAQPDRADKVAQMAAQLYAQSVEFREVLDFLADATLRRVTFVTPPLTEPMANYAYGCFREGQNAHAFALFKLIADGRDEQLKGRDA